MEAMTLEQVYYIGQNVGVIAVIATLVYVARQLRQNGEQMRHDAMVGFGEKIFELVSRVTDNREFAEVWVKGATDFQSLDHVDRQRLLLHERSAINSWHVFFGLYEERVLPDAYSQYMESAFERMGYRESAREAWVSAWERYGKRFREFAGRYFEQS